MMLFCSCTLLKPSFPGESISIDAYPYKDANTRPCILVTYCPAFGQPPSAQDEIIGARIVKLADVRPARDHAGVWSDEAMRYDLESMESFGINGCLLMLRPSELIDFHHVERIRHFFAMCATRRPVFKVGLILYSETPIDMGTGNVAQYLSQNGLEALPAALSVMPHSKSMLVLFDTRNIHLNRQHFVEEKQFDMKEWNGKSDLLSGNSFAMLLGGDCGTETEVTNRAQHRWPVPRGDGSFLANSLRNAFLKQWPFVCIHSWNWFADGSFISANSLDGTLLANVLREELDKLDDLRNKMQLNTSNGQ